MKPAFFPTKKGFYRIKMGFWTFLEAVHDEIVMMPGMTGKTVLVYIHDED